MLINLSEIHFETRKEKAFKVFELESCPLPGRGENISDKNEMRHISTAIKNEKKVFVLITTANGESQNFYKKKLSNCDVDFFNKLSLKFQEFFELFLSAH